MDITEHVKRNNFAVAQYEAKLRCTAQNCVFSITRQACLKRRRGRTAPEQSFESLSRFLMRESRRTRVAVPSKLADIP
jgi:hypothetical protein